MDLLDMSMKFYMVSTIGSSEIDRLHEGIVGHEWYNMPSTDTYDVTN